MPIKFSRDVATRLMKYVKVIDIKFNRTCVRLSEDRFELCVLYNLLILARGCDVSYEMVSVEGPLSIDVPIDACFSLSLSLSPLPPSLCVCRLASSNFAVFFFFSSCFHKTR